MHFQVFPSPYLDQLYKKTVKKFRPEKRREIKSSQTSIGGGPQISFGPSLVDHRLSRL